MRTFADRQKDLAENRYDAEDLSIDPTTPNGAKALLSSRGGKKAAQLALSTLWEAKKQWREGWLPTAKINAPLRVLEALHTIDLIEQANDDRGVAIRLRLTPKGVILAAKAQFGKDTK